MVVYVAFYVSTDENSFRKPDLKNTYLTPHNIFKVCASNLVYIVYFIYAVESNTQCQFSCSRSVVFTRYSFLITTRSYEISEK